MKCKDCIWYYKEHCARAGIKNLVIDVDCIWYYKEHCANGKSDYLTEQVNENNYCQWFECKEVK